MKRISVALLMALACTLTAKEFSFTVQKGGAEIIKSETGEQKTVSDSGLIGSKDMLSLTEGQQVAVFLEKNALVMLKGPASATFTENASSLSIALDDGQLLLNRAQPYEYTSFTITAQGVSFIPLGTCAAVKTSKSSRPTTAVIEGKIRMQAPAGNAIVVDKDNFGVMSPDGKLSSGKLSPNAIESLIAWRAEAPPVGNAAPEATAASAAAASEPAASTAAPVAPRPPQAQPNTAPPAPKAAPAQATAATASAPAAAPAPEADTPDDNAAPAQQQADTEESAEAPAVQKVDKTPAPPSTTKWEISAGSATIKDEQWTRIALGIDVPIWKFGIFFDVELFVDNEGQFSDKGWRFDDDPLDALSRKIRYIRFGQEGDPLFIKLGGLSSVTMGYGFIVDRFTNMLHYPDEKQIGLQFDINDISPIGISLQTLVADFKDFDNDGGVAAARLGFKPLKSTSIPILKGLTISGTYARDLNQYAPARKWTIKKPVSVSQLETLNSLGVDSSEAIRIITEEWEGNDPLTDNKKYLINKDATTAEDPFGLIGGDVSLPLISTKLVGLDLYGQAGLRDDSKHGWGIGAPGVALKVWRFWSNVEYRRVEGRFQPGYFGTYYLDERLIRDPSIITKEDRLISEVYNGVFGRLGFNINNVFLIEGSYQYMIGEDEDNKDQRFEAIGALGDLVLQRIPKLNRAEVYYYKSRINSEHDGFFDETPYMYYGYRAGFAISEGATLIWDARYGYQHDENGNLVSNNNISVQTAITF